ncbi:STAS domain-containing protein [candidate division KSB1 bacterium]|nr:STAS domain-containing protein [candidate division KSB1 bacterium]
MKYTTRSDDKVYIFELKGKVMGGPESASFHDDLKKAVAEGQRKVILDLGEVEWMNSSGLGLLISALSTMRNAGGELKLARVTDKIESLLVITKLNSIFEVHANVGAAMASLK